MPSFKQKKSRMKKVYLAGLAAMLVLGSCGGSETAGDINADLTSSEGLQEASLSFGEGGANSGLEYFNGLLSAVIAVDIKFNEIEKLDEMDASLEQINATIDSTFSKINQGRAAINLYKNESWPKRAEFHTLTEEWFNVIERITKDYLVDLAEPMSRPDETWSDSEFEFYDEYVIAYDDYLEVDQRWVDFQEVYAAANNFEIGGTIDEEALMEEELSASH